MKIAVFPGSFDPITKGHFDIVSRALPLFDKIVVAIGNNSSKQSFFDLDKRVNFLKLAFKDMPKVEIQDYSGLTVEYCKKVNADYILRGVRSVLDFEYEKSIAQMNKELDPKIETIIMLCQPQYSAISSTIVRDILKNGGSANSFLPSAIIKAL